MGELNRRSLEFFNIGSDESDGPSLRQSLPVRPLANSSNVHSLPANAQIKNENPDAYNRLVGAIQAAW